ncbi:MAG: diguanylate cyclase [Gammaproteobacteria bacterium]
MRVLILEDDGDIAASLAEGLKRMDGRYEIRRASLLSEAEAMLRETRPDIALVDLRLPDADGCDVAIALRRADPELPLVALTGQDFDAVALDLARYGVQDFLLKGHTTLPRVHQVLQMALVRHQREAVLRRQACLDPLTGAINRSELKKQLVKAISHANRTGRSGAIMILDIDDFKAINDTHGHQAGDSVLRRIVRNLSAVTRSGDSVGRLGGDEFAVILEGLNDRVDAARATRKASDVTNCEIRVNEDVIRVSTSIGVAMFPQQSDSPQTLFEFADRAMYRSKHKGKGTYSFYAPE